MKTGSHSRNSSAMSGYSSASIKLDPSAMMKHSELLQNYISSKSIYDLQEKSDLEIQTCKRKVDDILRREKTIVKEVADPLIIDQFISDHRKREVLNKKWNRVVFDPVYDKITRTIESGAINDLCNRKRELHQNYLDYVNKKDFVSLSAYCSDEYYPYALQSAKVQMQFPKSANNDFLRPTKSAASSNPTAVHQEQQMQEDNCQIRCLTGHSMNRRGLLDLRQPRRPYKPLGRQDELHDEHCCHTWAYLPYFQINSDVRHRSRKKTRGNFNHSSIHNCFTYNSADRNHYNNTERINIAI